MPLSLRLALRDLRGGLSGFGIFLACIALAVTAIVGVGSLSRALSDGLARQGRVILGGDVSFDLIQREATPQERSFFSAHGRLSQVALLRAMARSPDDTAALVEIKAVGENYPMEGVVKLDPPIALSDALSKRNDGFGLVVDPTLAARLPVKIGSRLKIGDATYVVRAFLRQEPDRLAAGIGLGPRVLMSDAALAASGLVQPGTLVRRLYRLALPGAAPDRPADQAALQHFLDATRAAFPSAGWDVRTRENVSPEFSRDLQRFTQFLILVGLTALMTGGVGIANAVTAFVTRKRASIATLKSLGASGTRVVLIMLIEVMLIAGLGLAIGLLAGAVLPFIVAALFRTALPFPLQPAFYPGEMAIGFVYGALTTLAFILVPLGRAHDIPVAALFRASFTQGDRALRWRYRFAVLFCSALLVGTILALAESRTLALTFLGAVGAGFVVLRLVSLIHMQGARRLPHPRYVGLRLALANIHRPGALTPTIVLSLGLGLGLLVALTLIDGNLRAQLSRSAPGETPSFFFLDVQKGQTDGFRQFLAKATPSGRLDFVPMLRGRIVTINGTPADHVKASEKAAWVLQGDRGITFAARPPKGSAVTQGAWWPADYHGSPLVSMEESAASGLGLRIGDTIGVNVLGREITARIANLRKVDWRSFGINFVLVFSPNTFAAAPYSELATVTFAQPDAAGRDLNLLRDVAKTYPGVTTIRVKDALDSLSGLLAQLAAAIQGAAGVALVASILVLAGALASGQEARLYDAVVLKTLGATRGRLLAAYLLEYSMLGFATAVFGVLAGSAAAYAIVVKVMTLDFTWLWSTALLAAGIALLLTILLGFVGTWRILGQKPASYLRSL